MRNEEWLARGVKNVSVFRARSFMSWTCRPIRLYRPRRRMGHGPGDRLGDLGEVVCYAALFTAVLLLLILDVGTGAEIALGPDDARHP